MGPHAPSAGTLDHEVDQVTQSIVFIQRQYPCDARVHPQHRLPSGGAGCEGSGSSPLCRRAALLACGAEGKLGLLDPGPTLRANSTNPALCSDPSQGDLPVQTLSGGPPGRRDAPGQLDRTWSHTQLQRFPQGPQPGWAASPLPHWA